MTAPDVDAYLAGFEGDRRATLVRLRALIREEAPGADESITYQIPTYKLDGKRMVYFAGWTKHYSLYPLGPRIPDALADELAAYETAKDDRLRRLLRRLKDLIRRIVHIRHEDATDGR